MNVKFFLYEVWGWLIHHGIPLTALVLTAILIPRLGRFAMRMAERQLSKGEEATKTRLALIGALVYVVEAVAFFFIVMVGLTNLGVPAMGAALPATVVSAAIGFGAQNVIGDFLAGFFIISERQFGLGDYVSFDGPSSPVEGTVVAITLRATRLRTPSGEMVNVPNGTTGVITNFSQEWSRAVVDIEIPMKHGESMAALTRGVEQAAQHAVRDPEVAKDVTDQLDVLPAMSLVQPATAGQPWSVQFRITADVNPARQWAVERAIRAAVANEFWERMQHAPAFGPSSFSDATTPADSVSANRDENAALTEQASGSEPKDDGPGSPSNHTFDPQRPGPRRDERGDIIDGEEDFGDSLDEAAFERHDYDTKLKNFLSIGGRTRVSTTLLFIALIFVGGLALAASNPEGGQAGLLNPARWQSTEETTEISETTPSAPESEVMETPTEEQPQYTEQPTDTTNQQTYEQTPQSESSQQQPDSSTQEQSTADNTQPSQ
ncbi:mechanosensitive ion channel domain-containing protein [uncultured Corynebacterium sp.]|uniref:mechanosensitive ion channel domain-containing protein n=1 Tax=uncultured Corynebacterium sp. TaxID=159447 RepID=UPI00259226C8|nr:mechanosensitive ion channel domain-containing protein [uncultured Corynebacterium sp.]